MTVHPGSAPRQNLLAEGGMALPQVYVLSVMFLANMTDGFDILAMSFAGPSIAGDLAFSPTMLGALFSSSFVGMALGSVAIGPLADRFGRKPTLLLCLALMTVGMVWTALGHSIASLAASRIVTGAGAGGLLPVISAVVAEYSTNRRRDLAISIAQMGFPAGGIVGGIVAALLLADIGWRGLFLCGSALSAFCFVIVASTVPESPDFLLRSRGAAALAQVNRLLSRLNRAPLATMPETPAGHRRGSYIQLFDGTLRAATITLCLCYFLAMTGYYSFLNWLPKLLALHGIGQAAGASCVTATTVGAVVGGLSVGLLSNAIGLRRMTVSYLFLAGAGAASIAFDPADIKVAIGGSLVFGWAFGGAMVGLFALLAQIYVVDLRATAAGIAIGAGRVGAIVGPFMCGIILDAGSGAATILALMAALLAAASAILTRLYGPAPSIGPSDRTEPTPEGRHGVLSTRR